jgi:hypothetical protein
MHPPADERRATAGRRKEDAELHDVVLAISKLEERLASRSEITPAKLAGMIGAATIIIGGVLAVLTWLGSETLGPGARLNAYRKAQQYTDSLAKEERERIQRSLDLLNERTARIGYDVCIEVFDKPVNTCFTDYRTSANALIR